MHAYNRYAMCPTIVMFKGIRASDIRGLNKGPGSKFHVSSQVIPEKSWRIYWPKRYKYNNKDEDNSPKIPDDKNINHFMKI